jgi:hypothetical protein
MQKNTTTKLMKIKTGKWYTCIYIWPSLILDYEENEVIINLSFLIYWIELTIKLK